MTDTEEKHVTQQVDGSTDEYELLCYLEQLEGFHGDDALKQTCQTIIHKN